MLSVTTLGDRPGHEFHGNQWTEGGFASPNDRPSFLATEFLKLGREEQVSKSAKVLSVSDHGSSLQWNIDAQVNLTFPDGHSLVHSVANSHLRAIVRNGKMTLTDIYVSPELRRQGVATGLVRLAEREARQRGLALVTSGVLSEAGKALFKKLRVSELSAFHAATLLVAAARRAGTLRALGDVAGLAVARVEELRRLGDVKGHPFHGNQWTEGQGGDTNAELGLSLRIPKGARVPDVYWGNASDARADFAYGNKEPRVYKGYIDMDRLEATSDVRPGSLRGMFKGALPAIGVQIKGGRDPVRIIDGNHRAEVWRRQGFTHAPAWIVDWRSLSLRDAGDVEGHPFHGNQWTTGTGDGEKRLSELAAGRQFYSIDKENALFGHLSTTERENYLNDFRRVPDARQAGASEQDERDITHLVSTQKSIEVSQVRELIRDPSLADDPEDGPPLIITWHGKDVVGDGHHRIAAAILRGEKKMQVEYLNLDTYLKKHRSSAKKVRGAEFNSNQPRDEKGKWTSGGAEAGYPASGEVARSGLDRRFPAAARTVDGREIPDFEDEFGPDVPNVGSISASLGNDYEILDGIREVKMSEFDTSAPTFYSRTEEARVKDLAEQIKRSGVLKPLIVVVDDDKRGPYILEGGHRFDALKLIGAKKFPAMVVVDTSEVEIRGAEFNPDQPRDESGKWTSEGPSGGTIVTKAKKAPKAPPVDIELKKKAYDDVKSGKTFKATAAKYGMTQGQLSGYVWKVDQKKKAIEEAIKQGAPSPTEVAPETPATSETPAALKAWGEMTPDEKLALATSEGYVWQQKTFGPKKGQYAWFDKGGQQASAPVIPTTPDAAKQALDTINYGKGISPPQPPTEGWPIGNDVPRDLGLKYPDAVEKAAQPWLDKLSLDERAAFDVYTGSGYQEINSVLRSGTKPSTYVKEYIEDIGKALDRAPKPPPPELVWRGVSESDFIKKLGTGDVIELKGFQSTSIRPQFATNWGSAILEIKPAKGGYIRPLSFHKQEYEYLLPNAAKYTVKGIAEVPFKGATWKVKVVQLEMHE